MQRNGRNSARFGARFRAVCGLFPKCLRCALLGCASRVCARRVKQVCAKVLGSPSRYAQDLNQPLPVALAGPHNISRLQRASVFEFTWVPRCACVMCAAAGDAFSIGHGAVKILLFLEGCVCRCGDASDGVIGQGSFAIRSRFSSPEFTSPFNSSYSWRPI